MLEGSGPRVSVSLVIVELSRPVVVVFCVCTLYILLLSWCMPMVGKRRRRHQRYKAKLWELNACNARSDNRTNRAYFEALGLSWHNMGAIKRSY